MMPKTIIRTETIHDFKAIYDINQKAFGQNDESELINKLRQSDAFIPGLSLVAQKGEKLVGHILFTRIYIVSKDERYPSLALAPMSVLPEFQKQGIGKLLIHEGLDKVKSLGESSVIVLGHEHYYPKFGFQPASNWNISCPFEVPNPVFMGIELMTDGLQGVEGTVEYAKPFMEM